MTRVLPGLAVLLALAGHARADEISRVRAHLTAALDHAQARDVSALTPHQRELRAQSLAVLEHYIARGVFPRRTDDAYPGLRPRFIDDRGVHCAVGHLIAASGAPDLARAIDAAYEYAYVRDIDSPALLAWADAHGFTVDELARIQPSYSGPPTPDSIRREIERQKGDYLLACVGADPPPKTVALEVVGDRDGVVQVTTKSEDGVARCFAQYASKIERGGGAYSPSPTAFSTTMTFTLPAPQELLERWLAERTGYGEDCTPRPGAVPTSATVDLQTTDDGLSLGIRVATKPRNVAVESCIADYLRPRLTKFRYHIKLHKQLALAPRVQSKPVENVLRMYAPGYATDCYDDGAPAKVTIEASAKRDDAQFALALEGAPASFTSCVTGKLQAALRKQLSVARVRGGKQEQYFRIDSDVRASLSFTIETPSQREQRLDKARKEMRHKRRKFEEERQRHKYDL